MKNGVVYTPKYIVDDMLSMLGTNSLIDKRIIDPSCGDGAFLKKIVDWVLKNDSIYEKKSYLEKNIYGIDVDNDAIQKCKQSLDDLCLAQSITNVKWNIDKIDFFEFLILNKGQFDIVIGNPPYIKVHDLNSELDLSEIKLTNNGMKDLYLMFYEGSLKLLNDNGVLLFISPNSFFTSVNGKKFREYIINENLLSKIVDLGHFNPFKNATAYTCITMLEKNKKDYNVFYSTYDGSESDVIKIPYNKFNINNNFYFGLIYDEYALHDILNQTNCSVRVKNAVSTNLDSFFHDFESKTKHTCNSIKLSNGKLGHSFFPYTKNGLIDYNLLTEEEKRLLNENKEALLKRDLRGQAWFGYARSQGIKDTFNYRIGFNNLIKSPGNLKIYSVPAGTVVYSGYYINIEDEDKYHEYKKHLDSERFFNYIKLLNKQKNGNYYQFGTKDVALYLSHMEETK